MTGTSGEFTAVHHSSAATEERALWVTAPGYLAQFHGLSGGETEVRVELEAGRPLVVFVKDQSGNAVGGAQVLQTLAGGARENGWTLETERRAAGESVGRLEEHASVASTDEYIESERARQHLFRETVADEEGRAELVAGRGMNSLLALEEGQDGRISRRVEVSAGDTASLELRSWVQVEGLVLADELVGLGGGRPQVAVGFMDKTRVVEAGRINIEPGGGFGRCKLPLTADGETVAWVLAEGASQAGVRAPAPSHGDVVRFEINPEVGRHLSVLVTDSDKRPLAGASVDLSWRLLERNCSESRQTNEQGLAVFSTLGKKLVYVQASKDGYRAARTRASGRSGAEAAEEAPLEMPLDAGGRVTGQVLYRGEPVTDFHLYYFEGEPLMGVQRSVHDPDGRFDLLDVPLGELNIYAVSDNMPRSETAKVNVIPGAMEELVLELSEPQPARGLVIDAVTRKPIPGVRIQLFSAYTTLTLTARNQFWYTDGEGRFELTGLAPGTTSIHFEHPEYSGRYNQVRADPSGVKDMGTVTLSRRGLLKISVSRQESDDSAFTCVVSGTNKYPEAEIPSDGQVLYPGSSAGHAYLYVVKGEPWLRRKLVMLPARKPIWDIPFDLSQPRTVEVTLNGDHDPGQLLCSGSFLDRLGWRTWDEAEWIEVEGALRAQLPYLPQVPVAVDVITMEGKKVGGIMVRPDGTNHQSVSLELSDVKWRMRVVDRAGEPVQGVKAEFTLPIHETAWAELHYTDADGLVELAPLADNSLRVCLLRGDMGDQLGELVSFPSDGEPVEVVFDPSHELRLRLMDGVQAIEAANVSVGHPDVPAQLMYRFTDDEGRLHWTGLGHRDIRLQIARHDLWPTKPILRGVQDGQEYTVQVRRLGGVELRAVTSDGVALPGLPVELVNEEYGKSVEEWIEAGDVSVEGGLVTDHRGKLTVTGIPNGRYRWAVGEASGIVTVPPEETGNEMLLVP
ncbi:MAG: carboxypeptidase-like regulatory domain-containing protein [Planctomycetota bacterium]|nr:carboxypeptidase-like regulatory domain-containing protein [Planctomycetota bacterium]